MLLMLELVVDEGSRSGIVLSRLTTADTGVDPGIAVTGAVVMLSLTQRDGADDENLNRHQLTGVSVTLPTLTRGRNMVATDTRNNNQNRLTYRLI